MLNFFSTKNNGPYDKLQCKWCIQNLCVENLILSISLGTNPKGGGVQEGSPVTDGHLLILQGLEIGVHSLALFFNLSLPMG